MSFTHPAWSIAQPLVQFRVASIIQQGAGRPAAANPNIVSIHADQTRDSRSVSCACYHDVGRWMARTCWCGSGSESHRARTRSSASWLVTQDRPLPSH